MTYTAIRRRHHPRSKNGCLTCKERHVRCDERYPFCRNCLHLGRECKYSGSASAQEPSEIGENRKGTLATLSPATQQAWVASTQPHQYAIEYAPPQQRGLSTSAVFVMHQALEIFSQRPWPRTCLLTIFEGHLPRYNYFGARFECVKYALVCWGAFIHYQETKSEESKEIYLAHSCVTFKLIQQEIQRLSPSSVDALLTASIVLAFSAETWEQKQVFVDGYSKALSYIQTQNIITAYPDLLTQRFHFRDFITRSDSPKILSTRFKTHERVLSIIATITTTKTILGTKNWHELGFASLEQVAHSVEEACFLESETELFDKLTWVRWWMFWLELGNGGEDDRLVLNCHFFALAVAAMPLFPIRFSDFFGETCLKRLDATVELVSEGVVERFGLREVCERAMDWIWQDRFEELGIF